MTAPKSACYIAPQSRTWNLEPGTWNLEPGTWNMILNHKCYQIRHCLNVPGQGLGGIPDDY
ncbi:MAG: hypothetical protein HOJ11_08475 [Gammaproteobacteria bacterium]|nr:hypothetical protein [Gammaproteobacteria bacterium]